MTLGPQEYTHTLKSHLCRRVVHLEVFSTPQQTLPELQPQILQSHYLFQSFGINLSLPSSCLNSIVTGWQLHLGFGLKPKHQNIQVLILSPWQAGSEALLSHGVPLASSDAHHHCDWSIPRIHKLHCRHLICKIFGFFKTCLKHLSNSMSMIDEKLSINYVQFNYNTVCSGPVLDVSWDFTWISD